MDHKTYTLLENHVLSCMTECAHDKEHIYRVLYNALIIAKTEEHVDTDILITACLLHDIGRQEQFENPALSHAVVGSEKAYRFLTEQGFDAAFAHFIKAHTLSDHGENKDLLFRQPLGCFGGKCICGGCVRRFRCGRRRGLC